MFGDRVTINKNADSAAGATSGLAVNATSPSTVANTSALFARVSRNSARVIVPINDASLHDDGRRPAFYCVHSASGVAGTDFMELAQLLNTDVRFFGIQAPPKLMPQDDFGQSIE